MASYGTQTAAMAAGGGPRTANSQTYDGSSWSEGNNLPAAKLELSGCGTTASALAVGGSLPPFTGTSEEYDGTNWTAGGTIPTVVSNNGTVGTQTAALTILVILVIQTGTWNYDGSLGQQVQL